MKLIAILLLWISCAASPQMLSAETKNSCNTSTCESTASCNGETSTSSGILKTVSLAVVIALASVFLARNQKNKWYLAGGAILCIALLSSLLLAKTGVENTTNAYCKPFNPNDTVGKNVFLPPGKEFILEDEN